MDKHRWQSLVGRSRHSKYTLSLVRLSSIGHKRRFSAKRRRSISCILVFWHERRARSVHCTRYTHRHTRRLNGWIVSAIGAAFGTTKIQNGNYELAYCLMRPPLAKMRFSRGMWTLHTPSSGSSRTNKNAMLQPCRQRLEMRDCLFSLWARAHLK